MGKSFVTVEFPDVIIQSTVLLTCQIEFLAKATACVLAAAFDKQLLDRSSILFVKQNINQRI